MSDIDKEQLEKARQTVIAGQKASSSWLQRQLDVSYTTAAALIEQLERDGVVSEPAGNGRRTVLIEPKDEEPPTGDKTGSALPAVEENGGAEQEGEGWDAEGEHTLAVDRISNMGDDLTVKRDGMIEEIRDFLLDIIKTRPKPWSGTSQAEKRDVAAACEHASGELVRKVIEAVASGGTDSVRVLLTKVTMGNDVVISGKVKAFDPHEEHKAISTLHGALNKHVMLTVANKDDYSSGDESEEAEEFDEPGFGFEGEDPDDDFDQDDEPEGESPNKHVQDAAVDAALAEINEG